jgi:MHS family proline/betaine transporter-like MFS transporter
MSIFKSLNREQKEAVGLLQVGTFLEYFDLMLYVHMAVLLNELFFPKTDPHTAALLSSFAFCSTYVFRPFGALIFGYIGDNIGRKATVIITTMMMSTSCIVMANLPTYAQIGISAAWIVTICRIVQGLSSMGEIMGALVYMTEITKPPVRHPAVTLISVASALGASAALGVAALVTKFGFNWRIAFWIGAGIAVIGSIARTRLRETPDFIENKYKADLNITKKAKNLDSSESLNKNTPAKEKQEQKTVAAFFLIYCGCPVCFYIVFIYFNQLLINKFGLSAADIIYSNFWLATIDIFICALLTFLSYRFQPLRILKFRYICFMILSVFLPFLIIKSSSSIHIFIIQLLILMSFLGSWPANGVFIKHIPVLKRMTATSFIYALSRALMHVITSFGLVYLTEGLGYYGLWVVIVPVTIGYTWAIKHFEKLEGASISEAPFSMNECESKYADSVQIR